MPLTDVQTYTLAPRYNTTSHISNPRVYTYTHSEAHSGTHARLSASSVGVCRSPRINFPIKYPPSSLRIRRHKHTIYNVIAPPVRQWDRRIVDWSCKRRDPLFIVYLTRGDYEPLNIRACIYIYVRAGIGRSVGIHLCMRAIFNPGASKKFEGKSTWRDNGRGLAER